MATNDEVKAMMSKWIQTKTAIDGALVRDAVAGNVGLDDWNSVAGWINSNDSFAFMDWIKGEVAVEIKTRADAEADAIYTDQALSHSEIERLFF